MEKRNQPWFEEWFDSPLYELLYANRDVDEAVRLAGLIRAVVPPETYPRLLDLGCGRGRHSITLAGLGYRVTGVDLSEEAIRKATGKAERRKIPDIRFLVGDMREQLPEEFDAVVNLFTSFGYFSRDDENRRVIDSVSKMLRTGGIFFMDYMNADWVRTNFVPEEEGEFRNIHYSIRRYIEDDVIYKKITFEGEELGESLTYQEQVKLYDLEWFLESFNRCGFSVEKLLGNYRGDGYNPRTCKRLVMVTRKAR